MSTLVTADAVVLEIPPAGLGTRLVAAAVDIVVYGVPMVLFVTLGPRPFQLSGDPAAAAATATIGYALFGVVAPATVETLTRGRSLGKLIMGLRVVRDDGGPVRGRQAATRALVGFVEVAITFTLLALVAMLWSSRTKRLGDLLAGTYVILERTPLLRSPMTAMPPELADWARTADLGRIPGTLALAGRTHLARAATLTPLAAESGARAIADELAEHVAPLPPAGTPPDRFVAAVLAERRRRDAERLAGERAQTERLRELTDRRRERV